MAAAASSRSQQLADAKRRVREAFSLFEQKDNSRMVETREIPAVVRSMGLNPSNAQLQMLQQAIAAAVAAAAAAAAAGGGADAAAAAAAPSFVMLEQCEGLIASWMLETDLARDDFHTLMRAFQACDPANRGWLDAEQLKGLLTACGPDALTPAEADAMLDAAADNQGRLNYQEYALRLATDGRGV